MKNKLRLAVVEPNNGGGLIHYTYQLCTALAEAGVDVTLITGTDYELADLPHNFRLEKMLQLWEHFDQHASDVQMQKGVRRNYFKVLRFLRRAARAGRLVVAWIRLTAYLVRINPDIIQFTRLEFPFEAFFIKYLRWRGFTLTQICHEFELRENQSWLLSLLLQFTGDVYSSFSAIFFHANENRSRFLSIYPAVADANTHIIPHGNSSWLLDIPARPVSDLQKLYGLDNEDQVVLFFGLLAPSKGIHDLIDAFAIASRTATAKLIIAGYPTKYINLNELHVRVKTQGIADRVIFDPRYIPLNEIKPLMSLATVVVYPYRSSTQSGALQAAYIFGRPVIATTIGGLPEAVEDGRSGFLISPGSPDDLAKKIITILNDSELAITMGQYARHLAETRFDWGNIAKQVAGIYEDLQRTGSPSK